VTSLQEFLSSFKTWLVVSSRKRQRGRRERKRKGERKEREKKRKGERKERERA
jgi:hypothetical protein